MSIKNRLKKLELATAQTDCLQLRIAFNMDTDTWLTMDEYGQLVAVEEKYPKNVLYISEEDALI